MSGEVPIPDYRPTMEDVLAECVRREGRKYDIEDWDAWSLRVGQEIRASLLASGVLRIEYRQVLGHPNPTDGVYGPKEQRVVSEWRPA